jgi:hypothetical protein
MGLFPSMTKGFVLNTGEAEEVAIFYGKKLVNCLTCLSDSYWFLVTSLDVFIRSNSKIDDCADRLSVGFQKELLAYVRCKGRFGKDYFEFSLKIGGLEMLATGGF